MATESQVVQERMEEGVEGEQTPMRVPGDPEMTAKVQSLQVGHGQLPAEKATGITDFLSPSEEITTTQNSYYQEEQDTYYPVIPESKAPVINKDEVAAQAAFIESSFTGKNFDDIFLQNRTVLETGTAAELQANAANTVSKAYEENAEETFMASLAAGDTVSAEKAAEYIQAKPVLNFEESFVSLNAGEVAPEVLARSADNMFVYNKFNQLIQDASKQITGVDLLGMVGHAFLPAHSARVRNASIERVLEQDLGIDSVSDTGTVEAFWTALLQLGTNEEKAEFIDKFHAALVDESGVMDDNYAEIAHILQQMLEFTPVDATDENAWAVFDAATLGTVAAAKALLKSGIKAHATIKAKAKASKILDEIEATELAANSVAKDILDGTDISLLPDGEKVTKALLSGHNPLSLDSDLLKGASDDVKKSLRDMVIRRDVQELVKEAGHTGVTKEQIQKITDKWNKLYDEGATPHYKEMELIDADDVGATYRILVQNPDTSRPFLHQKAAIEYAKKNGIENYELIRPEGKSRGWFIESQQKRNFTAEDVGKIEAAGTSTFATRWLPNFLATPAQTLKFDEVATAAINVHKEATARATFTNLWKDAFKGLNRKSKAKVQEALTKGDANGEVFKYETLIRSLDDGGMGLTAKEATSYYKARTTRDISYMVHDKAVRESLGFRGFYKVGVEGTDDIPGFETAGKSYTKEELKKFYTSGETTAFDISTGKVISLTDETIEGLYEQGNIVTRIAHPEDMKGISHDIIITKANKITTSELTTAIPYRQGEFSRMYSDDWFVSIGKSGYKNGKKTTYQQTFRTAPTHAQAKQWVGAHNAALKIIRKAEESGAIRGISKHADSKAYDDALKEDVSEVLAGFDDSDSFADVVLRGDIDYNQKFTTKFDREVPTAASQGEQIEAMFAQGRLFTGKRGEHLKSITGENAPIKPINEAIAKEMSYVSNFASLAKWRTTQVEQIINTYGKHLEPGASKYEQALLSEIKPSSLGHNGLSREEIQYLRRWRQHVITRLGMPSESALKARDVLIRASVWAEGLPYMGTAASKVARSFKSTSPTDWLRTAVFHSYLGMGNMAQLLVQANGAAIAATLHPVHGMKAGLSYPVIRLAVLADSLGNKAALEALASKVDFASLGMTGKEELLETVELVRKTGILNDIKSSALHYVKEGAIDLEGNDIVHAMGLWRGAKNLGQKALGLGLQPFQRGEETARIMALDIARRQWKKLNPGKSPLTRQARNEITTLQDKYTMGMTRGNMGRFQQGFAATPLQFAQFNIKLMESLLGKTLTVPEKIRLMMGGTLLYGTEGMGLTWLAQEVFGSEAINELEEDQKFALMEGGMSYLIKAATGAELAIGTRVGPGEYWANLTEAMAGDKTFIELATGASGSFAAKQFGAYGEVYDLLAYRTDDWSYEDTIETFDTILRASSVGWNNARKNYIAITTDNYIRNRYGAPTVKLDTATLIGGMMGLHSHKEMTNWRVNKDLQSADKLTFELSGSYEAALRRVFNSKTQQEHDRAVKQWHIFRSAMLEIHGPHIALEAEQKARTRAAKNDSMFARGLLKSQKPKYKDVETISPELLETQR